MADTRIAYILIPLLIAAFIGYSYYVYHIEDYLDDQDTLIYGQSLFTSGSTASFRIIALDRLTSHPVGGAKVRVTAKNKATSREIVLFDGKTALSGSPDISFSIPKDAEGEYDIVFAVASRAGSDELIRTIRINKSFKALLTTDKPFYQPGQEIRIRALALMDHDSTPVADKEITIEVEDPKGNKVFKKKDKTSSFGIAAAAIPLAQELNLGTYTIRAVIDDYSVEKKIEIKRYILPKFKIGFGTDKRYYLPGQRVSATVDASYFFGKPVDRAKVSVKAYTYEATLQQIGDIGGMTNPEGIFKLNIDLPQYLVGLPLEKGSGLVFFNISVTDQAGHSEQITSSVPVAKDPIKIELVPESGDLKRGLANIVYIITTYPDGGPAKTTVNINGQATQTDSHGIGEVIIRPESLPIRLQASAIDQMGNSGSITANFPIGSESPPRTQEEYLNYYNRNKEFFGQESLILRIDRSVLDVGETAHLNLFSTRKQGTVYIDVIKDKQTILTKALELQNSATSMDLDLDQSLAGVIEIHAYLIQSDSNIIRDTRRIFVNQKNDIALEVTPDKSEYLPGEDARISLRTTKEGRGVVAAIGLDIVDESVFALQEREAGFERLYFELEKELMTPRYMIYGITLPDLIYGEKGKTDEVSRARASNILMAGPPNEERFQLKETTRKEKLERAQKTKDAYFNRVADILIAMLAILPITMFGYGIYSRREDKKGFFGDSVIGILLILGITIISVIFWRIMFTTFDIYDSPNISLIILGVILASSVIAAVWAAKNDHFAIYFVSSIAAAQQISIFAILPLGYYGSSLILPWWISTIISASPIITSGILLARYARSNDESLFWTMMSSLCYVAALSSYIFINLFGGNLQANTTLSLIALFSSLFIPLVFGRYSAEFTRSKNLLAVPAILLALMIAIVPVIALLSSGLFTGSVQKLTAIYDSLSEEDRARMARMQGMGHLATAAEKPRVRQFFPETLYSNPQIITDPDGRASIDLQMADSITSWRMTALANSLDGSIGSNTSSLKVFQDFFVDIDLPIALTQGDEASIPVSVFNYLGAHQTVRLELKPEDWFESLDSTKTTVDIGANDIERAIFRIKAKSIGRHKLTVTSFGNKKSDAMARDIEVLPDGKEAMDSVSDRLQGEVVTKIQVPSGAIDGSEKLILKIYPGIIGQVAEGLDSMLRMPYGCFEQTSSVTYPNVLVLDYMKRAKKATPELQFKAEGFITTGYQRLMTFEAERGGFSIFGKTPAERIVTAYGLLEFADMAKVYPIDDSLIPRVQFWLLGQMQGDHWTPDGSYGAAYRARNNDVAATCYITWALLNSGTDVNEDHIQKALGFIESRYASQMDNAQALGLCALALSKGKRDAKPLLDRLDSLAKTDERGMYWTSAFDYHGTQIKETGTTQTIEKPDVETTSIVALAYMAEDYRINSLTNVMKFLISSKDPKGMWDSTQATVLALKALIGAIEKSSEATDARISVTVDGEQAKDITVNEDNKDVMQMIDLDRSAKKGDTEIRIGIKGKGTLFYQIVSSYYIPWPKDAGKAIGAIKPIEISIKYDKTMLRIDDTIISEAEVKYNGPGVVNYAIIDLGIPPGFSILTEDLDQSRQKNLIERYDVTGRQAIIYMKNLDRNGAKIKYRLKARYPIKAKTPASSVYDYYNPELRDESPPIEMTVT